MPIEVKIEGIDKIIKQMAAIKFTVSKMFKEAFAYSDRILGTRYLCKKTEDEILEKIAELNTGEPNIDTAEALYCMLATGIKFEKINIDTARLYFAASRFNIPQEAIIKYINQGP